MSDVVAKKTEVKPKERIPYFDNAKLVLVFLVVFGHFIQFYANDNKIVFALFDFIYLFHIPAFVLISGYFSKHLSSVPKRVFKYAIFYLLFSLYYLPLSLRTAIPFLLNPYYIMWYLISLISWNLLLILFKHIKFSVLVAFAIGISIGYVECIGDILSLSRTFVFFPFFLIGYYLNFDFLKTIKLKTKIIASLILIASFYLVYIYKIPFQWLFGNTSYMKLGVSEWYAGAIRIWIYLISALTCVCVLILIPQKELKITIRGTNTLNVYVLHGIFTILFASIILQITSVFMKIIVSFILSILLVLALSSRGIQKTVDFLIRIFSKPFFMCENLIIAKFKSNHRMF